MEILDAFALSYKTLWISLLLPFLYFLYQQRFWYRVDLLKKLDFAFLSLAIIYGGIILAKVAASGDITRPLLMDLVLKHLAPIVLIFLMVKHGSAKSLAKQLSSPKLGGRAVDGGSTGGTDYNPKPVNNQIENLSWNDIIISAQLKEELQSVVILLKDPTAATKYGIDVPKGILFDGPPGTGKTTIAKVLASVAGMNFFVLSADEVVSKWVGESEKNLSKLFKTAQRYAPAIIFIDEIDSIAAQRGGNQKYADNLLNHLLQLIDGVIKSEGLYIVAATNRADLVDSAIKRAGRLNKIITIPLPDYNSRKSLFAMNLSKLTLDANISLDALAKFTEGFSGADIKGICNQAGLNAFKREAGSATKSFIVSINDLESALMEFVQARQQQG